MDTNCNVKFKENVHCKLQEEKATKVGVAIFGLGQIGEVHFGNLWKNPRVRLHYCVEESSERANYIKNKWNLEEHDIKFLKTSEEDAIFNDSKVEAVVICSPTFTHEHLVMRSLESGKFVFCEKPLAQTHEGIQKCVQAAKAYSKPLYCAFNRRFDPGLCQLKRQIQAGEIGRTNLVKMCSRDNNQLTEEQWKITSGIFLDSAVHDLDYVCWLLDEYPVSVYTQAHAFLPVIKAAGDHDNVVIVMKFPSGTIATIDVGRNAVYGYDQRVEIFGAAGMLTCGGQNAVSVEKHISSGTVVEPKHISFSTRYKESYMAELEHFLNVVQGKEQSSTSGESILASSTLASACKKSVKTGLQISLHTNSSGVLSEDV